MVRRSTLRGSGLAAIAMLALVWAPTAFSGTGVVGSLVQTAVVLALVVSTVAFPTLKWRLVRGFQRRLLNPVVTALFSVGINPLGLAIVETTGRRSGLPRRTPVGNLREGDAFWIVAEHGERASYVRNLRAEPRVRVRVRVGWRYRWLEGVATVRREEDVVALHGRLLGWRHPLRALNAVTVHLMAVAPVVVRVDLTPASVPTRLALTGAVGRHGAAVAAGGGAELT